MTVCMTVLIGCGVDMGPLVKVMPKNGSGFALAMGLGGAMWRSSLD